jgi:hypothetical protein
MELRASVLVRPFYYYSFNCFIIGGSARNCPRDCYGLNISSVLNSESVNLLPISVLSKHVSSILSRDGSELLKIHGEEINRASGKHNILIESHRMIYIERE